MYSYVIILGYILFAFNKKFNCQQCLSALTQQIEDKEDPRNKLIDLREFTSYKNNLKKPNLNFVEWMQLAITFFDEMFLATSYKKNLLQNMCDAFLLKYTTLNCDEHAEFMVKKVFLIVLRAVLKRKNAVFKTSKRRMAKFDNLNHL